MNKDINIGDCQLMLGDCLEKMKDIPDGSVDMVLCDLAVWDNEKQMGLNNSI
jgi:predicted methyltransferase